MERYYNVVQHKTTGSVINGASVTVYEAVSGSVANPIYKPDGVTVLANPFLSGYARSEGEIEFAAANGQYNIKIVNGSETDWIYGISLIGIDDEKTVKDTLRLQVGGLTELRGLTPVDGEILYLKYHTTQGDGGHGVFEALTGAAPGTYTDDNGVTIVPTGGDGSTCWRALGNKHDSSYSPVIVTNSDAFRRKLHVMDFIDRTQWSAIESGNTAGQTAATVTAGVMNALREMKARKTELDVGYGIFLVDKLSLSGATDWMISGKGFFQMSDALQDSILDLATCERFTIDGVGFLGRSTVEAAYRAADLIVIDTSSFGNLERLHLKDFQRWGIKVTNLNGGTYTEGVFVDRCLFEDAPAYPADTAVQAGVAFGADGEYSAVTNSRFFRVPSAARFTDGANGEFSHNIVMDLNGGDGTLQVDRAAVYCKYDAASNAGKTTIANNKINHNETGLIPIVVYGDPSKPQNAYNISDNDVLVNGNATVGYQVVAYDVPHLKLHGNKFRAKVAATHPNVRLNDCDGAMIDENYFHNATYAVEASGSPGVQWQANEHGTLSAGKINLLGTSTLLNRNNRAYALRISSAGVAGSPWDVPGWTVSRIAAGHYQVTHDIGTTNYSATVTTDSSTTAPERRYSVGRDTTTLDIYITDGADAAVDQHILVDITIGNLDPYVL